ncbi:distal membrane-arm assembly complex protein 1 [Manis javanica]|uniref:distal membrane-arm assembly complex protein 1 n=1 Tax=Manis javanica TaxID=9974 RepID=UPI0008131D81|nr:distal membrane-arm assembly complex protein 1 [Manis javanica]
MGSSVSQLFEPGKVAALPEGTTSAKPAPLSAPQAPTSPAQAPFFTTCWSCRVLSGSGLIGAGGYVYWVARKPLKLGYPPSPGTITQMVIGISIACWGVVILSDPKGKAFRVV